MRGGGRGRAGEDEWAGDSRDGREEQWGVRAEPVRGQVLFYKTR